MGEGKSSATPWKIGVVEKYDPDTVRARVKLTDRDDMLTAWLPILRQRTKGDEDYGGLVKGEHVVCLLDEHAEDGVILGAIYSEADKPTDPAEGLWARRFADGTYITYNQTTHVLTVHVEGDGAAVNVTTTGNVSVDAEGNATVHADGDAELSAGGDADVTAAGAAAVTATGNATVHAGGNALVEATGQAKLKGATVVVEATTSVTVSAPAINLG